MSAFKRIPQAAGYWPMESGPLDYTDWLVCAYADKSRQLIASL